MDWVERLNRTINYIEENLTGEIKLDEIGRMACCSSYHYQRMFAYIADVPLSEYIRRRRMSRAAVDLIDGDSRVIDVAMKYGYDSPTAFNRAFRSVHGIAPSEVKKCGSLNAYPPISFKISIKGEQKMEYRIEKRDAFRIVGVTTPLAHEMEENFKTLPLFWQKVASDGTMAKLCTLMDGPVMGMLGVSSCNTAEDWKYYIAVASTRKAPDGFEEFQIPAATWAIFPESGASTKISELEKRILSEWLPSSGYEYANAAICRTRRSLGSREPRSRP